MSGKKLSEKEQQEIVGHFNRLREDQRIIATKAAELQNEQKSHEYILFFSDLLFVTFINSKNISD